LWQYGIISVDHILTEEQVGIDSDFVREWILVGIVKIIAEVVFFSWVYAGVREVDLQNEVSVLGYVAVDLSVVHAGRLGFVAANYQQFGVGQLLPRISPIKLKSHILRQAEPFVHL
jgi:hypothetical protein